jgi:hypothetical protein
MHIQTVASHAPHMTHKGTHHQAQIKNEIGFELRTIKSKLKVKVRP